MFPPALIEKLSFESGSPIRDLAMTRNGSWLVEVHEGEHAATLRPLPDGDVLLPLPPHLGAHTALAAEAVAVVVGHNESWAATELRGRPKARRIHEGGFVAGGATESGFWFLDPEGRLYRWSEDEEQANAISARDDAAGPYLAAVRADEHLVCVQQSADEGALLRGRDLEGETLWSRAIPTPPRALTLEEDGRLAVAEDAAVALCDPASGALRARMKGRYQASATWYEAALLLVSEDDPNTLLAWDGASDTTAKLRFFATAITALSRSGRYLLVGDADGNSAIFGPE